MFSEELERARDEQEGTGLEAERKAEVAGARRATRRASFGSEGEEQPRTSATAQDEAPRAAELAASGAPRNVRAPEPVRESPAPSGAPAEAGPGADPSPGGKSAPESSAAPLPAAPAAVSGVPMAPAALVAPERAPLAVASATPTPPVEPAPLAAAPTRAPATRGAPAEAHQAPAGQAALARAEEVLRQVELHLAGGVKRLSFELEPLDLGRLSIQLALRGGKLAAIVRGERPETLELLRAREADLKRLLAERGIAAEAVRFELGFRRPSEARPALTSSGPGHASRASGGPVSFDSYA